MINKALDISLEMYARHIGMCETRISHLPHPSMR